ncbi:MAG: hypothetical protein ACJAVV_003050 [Alphaproteobacteria bacterium]|jgi:hypothetical protein
MASSSVDDIVQLLLPEQGRSQAQRLAIALQHDYVAIEERSESQLFDLLKKLANNLQFYTDNPDVSSGNWSAFFPFEFGQAIESLAQNEGRVAPHLALIKVFLEQYIDGPVANQNNLKQAYIDYYYEQVLRFTKRQAAPEHAHVVLTLKKSAMPFLVKPEDKLLAGKRENGSAILVVPVNDTVINHAQVIEIRSVFASAPSPTMVKVAPVSNSADGLGKAFEKGQEQWSAFGNEIWQQSEPGFALSSPILQLREGIRQVTLSIALSESITPSNRQLNSVFKVFLSSEKGWTPSQFASASLKGKVLTLSIEIDASVPAIVPYTPDLHGFSLDTSEPVMQCVVDAEAQNNLLTDLFAAHIESITIGAEVTGVTSLNITSDIGTVSADNPFFPFGPSPQIGSVFTLRNDEIFSKRLKSVTANFAWKKAIKNLSDLYSEYRTYENIPEQFDNSYFTANALLIDGELRQIESTRLELFQQSDATKVQKISINEASRSNSKLANASDYSRILASHKSNWAKSQSESRALVSPKHASNEKSSKEGFVKLGRLSENNDKYLQFTLNKSFFHDVYRKAYVKSVIAAGSTPDTELVSEPYTPELGSVSLDYSAYTRASSFTNGSAQDFVNDEIRFFHLDCFGQRRDHPHQRQQLAFVDDKRVGLFAAKPETGALYIGLEGLTALDSCQLLFQVIEGSADPSVEPSQIAWSVLCDNYFQPLDDKSLVFDHTDALQTSGLVRVVLPKETTTENTLMPANLVWLKLSITGSPRSVCQLRSIQSNGIEVIAELATDQNSNEETATSPIKDVLSAGSISKFVKSTSSIKSVAQPYAGFGGASEETPDDYAARVSERLRHKDRALSLWDFESIVLAHFPNIHRVKTLPHSQPGNWRSPGNVSILLVPYVNVAAAAQVLTPKVSIHTINEIEALLRPRAAMQVKLHVINPVYISVRLSLQVAFLKGMDFNFYRDELDKTLQSFFAPWVKNAQLIQTNTSSLMSPQFGGRVYKSVVMDFIEELPYIDFISNVQMQATFDGSTWENDSNEIKPMSPDQIITSTQAHVITQVTE